MRLVPGPFPTEGAWSRPELPRAAKRIVKTVPLRRVGKRGAANLAAFWSATVLEYQRDSIVIPGGKMLQSGGGGAKHRPDSRWTDEQWDAIRPEKKKQ